MKKTIIYFNILALSAIILCANVYGQDNWQLYDNFSSGSVDLNKWIVDESSAIIIIENGRAKFVHQAGNAADSSWLTVSDNPETITGLKATITVESCSGDVQARIGGFFGKVGSDFAWSHQAIRPYQERIIAAVGILGPEPNYEHKYNYFWGNYKSPLVIIGVPYTLSTILSTSNARYLVDGLGELEYSFPSNLEPLAEGESFIGMGTRSTSGVGDCTVYFDDVYITRKAFPWPMFLPAITNKVEP